MKKKSDDLYKIVYYSNDFIELLESEKNRNYSVILNLTNDDNIFGIICFTCMITSTSYKIKIFTGTW